MNKAIDQSVKDQLKNLARKTGKDFNFLAIQYLQERFLARLERSAYLNHFILKGALLFVAHQIPLVRPSKDIDFLGQNTSNDIRNLSLAIQNITNIRLNDGVQFQGTQLQCEKITEEADYTGYRFKIPATAGGDSQRLQIDIGFGDVLTNGPVDLQYPSLLNFNKIRIKAYSLESSIAEKLEAIVRLGFFGSRMKDYFDIWFLIQNSNINKKALYQGIYMTFKTRQTTLSDVTYIFDHTFKYNRSKQQQWQAFLNRSSINLNISFANVVDDIKLFLSPIIEV